MIVETQDTAEEIKRFRKRVDNVIKIETKILKEQSESGTVIVVCRGQQWFVNSVSLCNFALKLHVKSMGEERKEDIAYVDPEKVYECVKDRIEIFCYRWKNGIRKRESRFTIYSGAKKR